MLKEKGYIHFRDNKLTHLVRMSKEKNVKVVIIDIYNHTYRIIDVKDICKTNNEEDLNYKFIYEIPQFGNKSGHRLFLDYSKMQF